MIIQGPNIERQIRQNFGKVRAAILICEVLMFNSVIMSRTSGPSSVRHSTIHDVSLLKDITMKLHAEAVNIYVPLPGTCCVLRSLFATIY